MTPAKSIGLLERSLGSKAAADQFRRESAAREERSRREARAAFFRSFERGDLSAPQTAPPPPNLAPHQIDALVLEALERLLPPLIERAVYDLVSRRLADELPSAVEVAVEAELATRDFR